MPQSSGAHVHGARLSSGETVSECIGQRCDGTSHTCQGCGWQGVGARGGMRLWTKAGFGALFVFLWRENPSLSALRGFRGVPLACHSGAVSALDEAPN